MRASITDAQWQQMIADAARKQADDMAHAVSVRDAIVTLMERHGHTLTPEQRAAVRGWLGRTA